MFFNLLVEVLENTCLQGGSIGHDEAFLAGGFRACGNRFQAI